MTKNNSNEVMAEGLQLINTTCTHADYGFQYLCSGVAWIGGVVQVLLINQEDDSDLMYCPISDYSPGMSIH